MVRHGLLRFSDHYLPSHLTQSRVCAPLNVPPSCAKHRSIPRVLCVLFILIYLLPASQHIHVYTHTHRWFCVILGGTTVQHQNSRIFRECYADYAAEVIIILDIVQSACAISCAQVVNCFLLHCGKRFLCVDTTSKSTNLCLKLLGCWKKQRKEKMSLLSILKGIVGFFLFLYFVFFFFIFFSCFFYLSIFLFFFPERI